MRSFGFHSRFMGIFWKRRSRRRLTNEEKSSSPQGLFSQEKVCTHNSRDGAGGLGRWGKPIFPTWFFLFFLFSPIKIWKWNNAWTIWNTATTCTQTIYSSSLDFSQSSPIPSSAWTIWNTATTCAQTTFLVTQLLPIVAHTIVGPSTTPTTPSVPGSTLENFQRLPGSTNTPFRLVNITFHYITLHYRHFKRHLHLKWPVVHQQLHVIRNTAHRPSTQASYTASLVRPKRKISCAAAQIAATLTISFPRWRHTSITSYWGQQRMSLTS